MKLVNESSCRYLIAWKTDKNENEKCGDQKGNEGRSAEKAPADDAGAGTTEV